MKNISKKIGEINLKHPVGGMELFEIFEMSSVLSVYRTYKGKKENVGKLFFDVAKIKDENNFKKELNISGINIEKQYRRRKIGNLLLHLINKKDYDLINYNVITNRHYLEHLNKKGVIIDPKYQSITLKKGELSFDKKDILTMDKQLEIFCNELSLNHNKLWSEIVSQKENSEIQKELINELKQKFSTNKEMLSFIDKYQLNPELSLDNNEKEAIASLLNLVERIKKDMSVGQT